MMKSFKRLMIDALEEDIGQEDITTNRTVPADARCRARLLAKQEGVLSGIEVFRLAFDCMKARIKDWDAAPDGTRFKYGDELAAFEGNARAVLTAERTALNFVQRLSGIATLTRRCVESVAGHDVKILDTRKTTPGLRALEKYAVRAGGGTNHRMGLYDQVLIKDNHLRALLPESGGGEMPDAVLLAVRRARERVGRKMLIEVEAESLPMVFAAVAAGADIIMLDNMTLTEMRKAARFVRADRRNSGRRRPITEASGGVTLKKLPRIAATGVDAISLGMLTHSAPALDFAMDVIA